MILKSGYLQYEISRDIIAYKNVLPAINILNDYKINEPYNNFENMLKTTPGFNGIINFHKAAIIKTKVFINLKENYMGEKSTNIKYKKQYEEGAEFPPILLVHKRFMEERVEDYTHEYDLDFLDGLNRMKSAYAAGINLIDAYIVVNRDDIPLFMREHDLDAIKQKHLVKTWFPQYQQIKEVGIDGNRRQEPRYTSLYDFTKVNGKSIVDFGGNLGQASIEAYFCGATNIYNIELQPEVVETAQLICDTLGLLINNIILDMNDDNFYNKLIDIVGKNWDWSVFQAIVRNGPEDVRDKNLKFIVDRSIEGIFFEGHAADIDTEEFYRNKWFEPYEEQFKNIEYKGRSDNRPVFLMEKKNVMRILVVLVNYGLNQLKYLEKVVREYQNFDKRKYEVDIIIHTNVILDDITGISYRLYDALDDWEDLPFTTRHSIYALRNDYDLYIYSENDHLITQNNIDSWLEVNKLLPNNLIPGFIQVEKYENDYFYPAYHANYHWDKDSVIEFGKYKLAYFTNVHQASFVLTKKQLHRVIDRLDLFIEDKIRDTPYNKKPRAGTDVYTHAGMKKLIPISHFDDFLIQHLPNKYKDHVGDYEKQMGCFDDEMRKEVKKLL